MWDYLIAFAIIFGINLLPAFGPPTGAVLVFLRLNSDLAAVPLVIGGALAAASGRFVLASVSRKLRGRFSPERIASLDAVHRSFVDHRGRSVAGLGLFVLSPLPSAQLFIGAGLTGARPLPFTIAFFCGRLVSYSIYVAAASVAKVQFGDIVTESLTSPLGITLQLLTLLGLALLLKLDWAKLLRKG